MNLADRIARLEAKLLASSSPVVPVLRIALNDGADASLPYCVEHDGATWTQAAGESLEALMDRAQAEALRAYVPSGEFPCLCLIAERRRP